MLKNVNLLPVFVPDRILLLCIFYMFSICISMSLNVNLVLGGLFPLVVHYESAMLLIVVVVKYEYSCLGIMKSDGLNLVFAAYFLLNFCKFT